MSTDRIQTGERADAETPTRTWGERALAKLLGSAVRAKVIGWVCTHPEAPIVGRELARSLAVNPTAVSKELRRLQGLGLLRAGERMGRAKPYHLNERSPLLPGLRSMVLYATGVVATLRDRLRDEADIDIAFIYGSLALGTDRPTSDVDVAVIGGISGRRLASLIWEVERTTRRQVNEVHYSREEFARRAQEGGGFVSRALDGAKVFLKGDEDALRELAR